MHRATNAVTASGSPDTTVEVGPLTTATESPDPSSESSCRTRAAGRATDAMPPLPASSEAITLLRIAANRAPSSSERPPATHAAAISPWE